MLLALALIYVALLAGAYFFSDSLIFQPQAPSYGHSPDIITLSTGSKKISALYLPNPRATFTLLVSHGNAEDLGDIRDWLESLRRAGFSVFAYDYEGYGTSEGRPSESAAYQDESAAYDYLAIDIGVPPDRIIILGRSVGSGPAVYIAARRPAAGLVLQSPFVSAFRVLTRVPVLPFDKFPNYKRIAHVHCPVLIVHGAKDSIIGPWHGRKLFDLANKPKNFVLLEGVNHNDVDMLARDVYNRALASFATSLPAPASE
jgi:fermentation-respiration switch protein FrsA (DUF1100 family)